MSFDVSELSSKNYPFKKLVISKKKKGGRNHQGVITVRHRGGGHKRLYRVISFERQILGKDPFPFLVKIKKIEYDPNRSAFIALVCTVNDPKQKHYYVLAPDGVLVNSLLFTGSNVDIFPGNTTLLRSIPIGTQVHNIELYPGRGGKLVRSAGTSALLLKKELENNMAMIRMASGQTKMVSLDCAATIGQVSNKNHLHRVLYKAGQRRWLGFRPTVRGVAMNPVDHPHGGGEGKTSGGRPSCSPWGKPTKGLKTRSKKKR